MKFAILLTYTRLTHTNIHTLTHARTRTRTNTHTHARTHTHTYTNTHTHTHAHTHNTDAFSSSACTPCPQGFISAEGAADISECVENQSISTHAGGGSHLRAYMGEGGKRKPVGDDKDTRGGDTDTRFYGDSQIETQELKEAYTDPLSLTHTHTPSAYCRVGSCALPAAVNS